MSAVLSQLDVEAQRTAVAIEAIAWKGTPYHAHGRLKGVGVDCANFILKVYELAGVVPVYDPGFYPTAWHLHRSEELFLDHARSIGAREVTRPQIGDFGVWRFGRTFSHGGILVAGDDLVAHAYIDAGVMLSRASEEPLASRPVRWFTVWE